MSDVGEVLGARNPTTIREHLMESLHEIEILRLLAKGHPATDALRNLQEHAVAALDQQAQIDSALNKAWAETDWRYVSDAMNLMGLFDPDPGVGAEHAPKHLGRQRQGPQPDSASTAPPTSAGLTALSLAGITSQPCDVGELE